MKSVYLAKGFTLYVPWGTYVWPLYFSNQPRDKRPPIREWCHVWQVPVLREGLARGMTNDLQRAMITHNEAHLAVEAAVSPMMAARKAAWDAWKAKWAPATGAPATGASG